MIRWRGSLDGRETIGLGIEAGNVERLMNGEPIRVKAESMGLPFDILIHYGSSKDALIAELEEISGKPLPQSKAAP